MIKYNNKQNIFLLKRKKEGNKEKPTSTVLMTTIIRRLSVRYRHTTKQVICSTTKLILHSFVVSLFIIILLSINLTLNIIINYCNNNAVFLLLFGK